MRDPQKDRVYAWEGKWADWNRTTLTMTEVREIIRWACKEKYGLKPLPAHTHRGTGYAMAVLLRNDDDSLCVRGSFFTFNQNTLNPAVVLHECAHYICDAIFGTKLADHCPEWLGIYLWLLEGWRIAPRSALHSSAKANGLRWLQTWIVSPKRLRNKVALRR